jgi:hypothetical protein
VFFRSKVGAQANASAPNLAFGSRIATSSMRTASSASFLPCPT